MKMKIAIVYGTRPELIKLIPLILLMKGDPRIDVVIINTGQHKEMVDDLEALFGVQPHHKLEIMSHNQSLTEINQRITQKIEPVLKSVMPSLVLVQGDTSTVTTVGMYCFYNRIAVGHVEAGLRSHNLDEPFPEEFNRRVISIFARYNFAPTQLAADNLRSEGISPSRVFITGNTIVDMVGIVKEKIPAVSNGSTNILITAHRRENHGIGIKNICDSVKAVIEAFPDVRFTWPVHPNPNVQQVVMAELSGIPNVKLTPPMNYMDLSSALASTHLIWTDSGGIQEESPSYKKPVLILRNVTERPEIINSGFGKLVGTDPDAIISSTKEILTNEKLYKRMISGANPFGDGHASEKIRDIILNGQ